MKNILPFFFTIYESLPHEIFSIISYMFNLLEIFFLRRIACLPEQKLLHIEHLQLKQMFILYFTENDTNPHRGHYLRLLLCHSPW